MTDSRAETHLILGGARSGKSSYAESICDTLVQKSPMSQFYLATATAGDQEMKARIRQHQRDRHEKWQLIEEPIMISEVISSIETTSTILIDCMTLWLSNCMHQSPAQWPHLQNKLVDQVLSTQHNLVLVSNEVGSGVIPLGELSRAYVDNAGWLHQKLANACTNVTLVTAGIPHTLKPQRHN